MRENPRSLPETVFHGDPQLVRSDINSYKLAII